MKISTRSLVAEVQTLRFTVQRECDASSSVRDMWEASVGEELTC